jgi:hypothetical protein
MNQVVILIGDFNNIAEKRDSEEVINFVKDMECLLINTFFFT